MKHAFLVIAHNNFGVLQKLVSQLDADGCDFFIHYDRKVKELPEIRAVHSRVAVCNQRVDVRWGDISQIRCEMTLLGFALSCGTEYDYYHIISGAHLPLTDKTGFDEYFSRKTDRIPATGMQDWTPDNGIPGSNPSDRRTGYMDPAEERPESSGSAREMPAAVFQLMDTEESEADMKLRRWNLCTRTFKNKSFFVERSSQLVWRFSNAFQRIIGIRRYREENFIKACQWCSLSHDAASFLYGDKERILKKYRWSFCGDEYFAPSEIVASCYGDAVDFRVDYLFQHFCGPSPVVLRKPDLAGANGYLWARKFSDESIIEL